MGAVADARGLRPDRRRQRVDATAPASWRASSARRSCPSRSAGSARPASPACSRREPRSSASWTATRRSTRASSRSWPDRCSRATPISCSARERGAGPLHARVANRVLALELRRRSGARLTDIGPMRAARREALLALGIADRRFGWPLEMVLRAADAGWTVTEVPISYLPRRGRSKVTGTVRGTAACGPRHGGGTAVTAPGRDREGAGRRPRQDAADAAVLARQAPPRSRPPRWPTRWRLWCGRRRAGRRVLVLDGAPGPWIPTRLRGAAAARRRPGGAVRRGVRRRRRPRLADRHGHATGHARAARRRPPCAGRRGRRVRPRARRRLLGDRAAPTRRRRVPRRADERAEHRGRAARASGASSSSPPSSCRALVDVDTIADARRVAAAAPHTRFARALERRSRHDRPRRRRRTSCTGACWRPPPSTCSTAACRRSRRVRSADGTLQPLPLDRWVGAADAADARCSRSPPRRCSTSAAARAATSPRCAGGGKRRRSASTSRPSRSALARGRGATAIPARSCSTTSRAPARWRTTLLLDGNIGIGGAPVALLRRAGELLAPGGATLVELDPPGAPTHAHARPDRGAGDGQRVVPLGAGRRRRHRARSRGARRAAGHRAWTRRRTAGSRLLAVRPPPGPFRPGFFRSPLRGPWLTAALGSILLVLVAIVAADRASSRTSPTCRTSAATRSCPKDRDLPLTFDWPTRPSWLYAAQPGPAHERRADRDPVPAGEAVVGDPAAVRVAAGRAPAQAIERLSIALLVASASSSSPRAW